MRAILAFAALAVVTSTGTSATAATVVAHLDGYIEQQEAPGTDSNLTIGSKVSLNATYNTDNVYSFGDQSYQVAFVSDFMISAGSYNWITTDETSDGSPVFTYDRYINNDDGSVTTEHHDYGNPVLAIQNGKIIGVTGEFVRTISSTIPGFSTHSSVSGYDIAYNDAPGLPVVYERAGDGILRPTFAIESNFIYGNTAKTPGFIGRWDFANSSLSGVPEPATWALMVIGFGAVGAAMRKRQRDIVAYA